jgi:polysaccharide export outer membrane protein
MRAFFAAGLALWLSCGDPPPSKYPVQAPHVEDTALGPGDVFDVRVFYGSKDIQATYRVGTDGTISFPYIGTVQVGGKTPVLVETEIRDRLADGYLRNPIVSVLVKERNSKRVHVMGQVKTPGVFPFTEGMTVVEAIAEAGGFTPMARKNAVVVTRDEDQYTVPVESISQGKAPNFALRPGDVVSVPERAF